MSAVIPPIISLLTDFGSRDTYVGQMKGAILSLAPRATLVDLTHEIPAGDIIAGSLAWLDAVAAFPPGTIHLGVVDPGVGSERRAIVAEIGAWRFVCPDNGLLTGVLQTQRLHRAVEVRETRFWRNEISPVFHGRDIFGPVAAHLAAGIDLGEFGPAISSPLVEIDLLDPTNDNGVIQGCVLAADRFGNLRTNIPATLLSRRQATSTGWTIEIGDVKIHGVVRCYSDSPIGQLCTLIGSHGHLEIAVNQGHAQELLHAVRGTMVTVRQA